MGGVDLVLIKIKLELRSGGSLQVFKHRSDMMNSIFWKAVNKEEELGEGENRGRDICVTLFQGEGWQKP